MVKVLLTEGELAASEIQRSLPDPASNSAVRTMLTRLEVKGLVTHRQAGAKYLYRAVIPRGRARKRAVKDIVSVFFEGSPGRAAIDSAMPHPFSSVGKLRPRHHTVAPGAPATRVCATIRRVSSSSQNRQRRLFAMDKP